VTWGFLPIEIAAFGFGAYALKVARGRGARDVSTLIVAMAFGLAVEFFFVLGFTGYAYGEFLVMPTIAGHSVPLWVAVGWGTIIYACMRATDRLGIHWSACALLDGLLAVSLDISLDPIAEALGFWKWSPPGPFYGVPYDNFIGWVMIVASFSLLTRAAYRWLGEGSRWTSVLRPVAALVPAVVLVGGLQFVLDHVFYPRLGQPLSFFVIAMVLLALTGPMVLRTRTSAPLIPLLLVVPVGYHGLFLGYLLLSGLHAKEPTLLMLMPLAAMVSVAGFAGLAAGRMTREVAASREGGNGESVAGEESVKMSGRG